MKKQLRLGIGIESEHKSTVHFIKGHLRKYKKLPAEREIYRHIASDHLKEDKEYYSKLKRCKL